jgi:hypothetical protein
MALSGQWYTTPNLGHGAACVVVKRITLKVFPQRILRGSKGVCIVNQNQKKMIDK